MERAQEIGLLVAYQGEPGAYSEDAVLAAFGTHVCPVPQPTFAAVFQAVAAGTVDAGLVPIENSHIGRISAVETLLSRRDVQVIGERWQPIHHCLLALIGQKPSDIRQAWSHPQALAQCAAYLRERGIEAVAAPDTAGAARLIREQAFSGIAAIASARAARLYQLDILARDIQTTPDNRTHFLILHQAKALVREDFAVLGHLKTLREGGQHSQARQIALALKQQDHEEEWGMRYGS